MSDNSKLILDSQGEPVNKTNVILDKDGKPINEDFEIKQERCDHGIFFDEEAAKNMPLGDVRKLYPRLFGICPKGCGFDGIAYASYAHYIYGDW